MTAEFSTISTMFFKTLANETRLKMIGLLSVRKRTIEELAEILGLKQNRVLHNLESLMEMDLVEAAIENGQHVYMLNEVALFQLNKESMQNQAAGAQTGGEAFGEEAVGKVLRSYIENNQLVSIPTKRSKRNIILNWLVNKFEMGVKYPEKEVNRVLAQYHPDVATLRREFIMTRLMKREDGGGCYWRI